MQRKKIEKKVKNLPEVCFKSREIFLQSSQVLHLNKVIKDDKTFSKSRGNFKIIP